MAERVTKQVFETEFKVTGAEAFTQATTQFSKSVKDAGTDAQKLIAAEKQFEQAANAAGQAVDTQTKKTNSLSDAIGKAGKAMEQIGQKNQMKEAFKVDNLDKFKTKLSEIIIQLSKGVPIDKITKDMSEFVNQLPNKDKVQGIKLLEDELKRLAPAIERPTLRLRELVRVINTTTDPKVLKNAQIEAGKLRDELQDTNELIRALSSDTFFADTLVEGAQVATGAFTAFQGAAALFTEDQEEFAKAAQKAQAALALLQGVQTVLNDLKKEDNIITRSQIVFQQAYQKVIVQSTFLTQKWRVALLASGIGIVVLALAALVANFDKVKAALGLGVNPETEKYIRLTNQSVEAANRQREAFDANAKILRAIADAQIKGNEEVLQSQLDRLDAEKDIIQQEQDIRERQKNALDANIEAQVKKLNELKAIASTASVVAAQTGAGAAGIAASIATGGLSDKDVKEQEDLVNELLKTKTDLIAETFEANNKLVDLEKDKNDKIKAENKKVADNRFAELAEAERHALALAGIERKSSSEILAIRIDFAQKRLKLQQQTAGIDKVAIQATKNLIEELRLDAQSVAEGSINALSEEVNRLKTLALEAFAVGSDGFNKILNEYNIAALKLDAANKLLEKKTDAQQFTEGTLAFLENRVSQIREQLSNAVEDTAEFDELIQKLKVSEAALADLRKKIDGEEKVDRTSTLSEIFSEQERHQLAMESLKEGSEIKQLEIQKDFAQRQLDLLIASNKATEVEILAAQNRVAEIEAQIEATKLKNKQANRQAIIDASVNVVNVALNEAQQLLQIEINKQNQLLKLQQQRVNDAEKIADRGNVALLEAEQKRLDEINEKRQKFLRQQQALARIQLITDSVLAVAKAAAQGGVAAPFTIAATLAALAIGLAQARAQSESLSFKKGGVFDSKGGFTGYGPPDGQSLALGEKPYQYHYQEHIMPAPVTGIGNNLKWLEKIRLERIDIGKMMTERNKGAVVNISPNDNRELIAALGNIAPTHLTIAANSEGIIDIIGNADRKRQRLKTRK